MSLAIEEAKLASRRLEVPVGAVLVRASTGEVLAAHHNTVDEEDDPTAHAELKCIRDGAKRLGGWRYLAETTLYVTLEPCPMCAGAVLNARLGEVVWGAPNPLIGGDGSWLPIMGDSGGAIDDYGLLIRMEPRYAPAYNGRAWRRFVAGIDYAEALEDIEIGMALQPDNTDFVDTQAHLLSALGRPEEALYSFLRAAELGGPERILWYQE